MKIFKRLSTMMLAAVMMLTMTIPALAANDTTNPEAKALVSVTNLNEDTTKVTAYLLTDAQYVMDGDTVLGFSGYKFTSAAIAAGATYKTEDGEWNGTLKDPYDANVELTAAELQKLAAAKGTLGQGIELELSADKTIASRQLGTGVYLIIAEGTETIYNPMMAGVYYKSEDGSIATDPIDADGNFELHDTVVYAKKDKVDLDKKIIDNYDDTVTDGASTDTIPYKNAEGEQMYRHKDGSIDTTPGEDGVALYLAPGNNAVSGGDVYFQIRSDIPVYTEAYKNEAKNGITYKITDSLSTGFDPVDPSDVEVYLRKTGDSGTTAADTKLTEVNAVVDVNGRDMTITIKDDDFLVANAGQEIIVVYKAKLNSSCEVNEIPNTNTAQLEYTNSPGSTDTAKTDEKRTYTYTFAIDGGVTGESEVTTHRRDVYKSGVYEETQTSRVNQGALSGAEFTLYVKGDDGKLAAYTNDKNGGNPNYTVTTDVDGHMTWEGLEAGTYYIRETKAPAGYTISEVITQVTIKAEEYNSNGQLTKYSIKFGEASIDEETGVVTDAASLNGKTYEVSASQEVGNQQDSHKVIDTIHIISEQIELEGVDKPNQAEDGNAAYELKNTQTPLLPSTGGAGTFMFTMIGAAVVAAAMMMALFGKRNDKSKDRR